MALRVEYAFEAGVEDVHAVLTDPEFLREYGRATHSRDVSVTASAAGSRLHRVMPTDAVPPFAKSFLGDEVPVLEVVTWEEPAADGSRSASLAVDAAAGSRQARLRGSLVLTPAGGGCGLLAEGDVRVNVPLVGGRLAPLVVQVLESALRRQCALAAARLAPA